MAEHIEHTIATLVQQHILTPLNSTPRAYSCVCGTHNINVRDIHTHLISHRHIEHVRELRGRRAPIPRRIELDLHPENVSHSLHDAVAQHPRQLFQEEPVPIRANRQLDESNDYEEYWQEYRLLPLTMYSPPVSANSKPTECSICYQTKTHFVQCDNGHGTCIDCRKKILEKGQCPFCRCDLKRTKQEHLNLILTRLQKTKQLVIDAHTALSDAREEYNFAVSQEQLLVIEYNHILTQPE